MRLYNGLSEDDYAELMHKENLAHKNAEIEYENSMINAGLRVKDMSCEEQLIEQASYYESNCFNTYKR